MMRGTRIIFGFKFRGGDTYQGSGLLICVAGGRKHRPRSVIYRTPAMAENTDHGVFFYRTPAMAENKADEYL